MKTKIVALTSSCGKCPNYVYYSGARYHCSLVEQVVIDREQVAPFCPLPDYPSQVIADMEMTILGLREPNKYDFGLALLTHLATKLKRNLHANMRGITISFKDGKENSEVILWVDCITEISMNPGFEITFVSGEKTFKFFPDVEPPHLKVGIPPNERGEPLWLPLDLVS